MSAPQFGKTSTSHHAKITTQNHVTAAQYHLEKVHGKTEERYTKASASASALPKPLKNTTSPASAITKSWAPFMKKAPKVCCCKIQDQKLITAAPTKWSAWLSAVAF